MNTLFSIVGLCLLSPIFSVDYSPKDLSYRLKSKAESSSSLPLHYLTLNHLKTPVDPRSSSKTLRHGNLSSDQNQLPKNGVAHECIESFILESDSDFSEDPRLNLGTLYQLNYRDFPNKKHIVLDLDETLIYRSLVPHHNAEFTLEVENPNAEGEEDGKLMMFYIAKRPGLDAFLRFVTENFHVSFFTAGLRFASEPLVHKLMSDVYPDPKSRPSYDHFYRDSITYELETGSYYKDLSTIGCPLDRTILIDNSFFVFKANPLNGIEVVTWEGDNLEDVELATLIPVLKDFLRAESLSEWRKLYFNDDEGKVEHKEEVVPDFTEVSSDSEDETLLNEAYQKMASEADQDINKQEGDDFVGTKSTSDLSSSGQKSPSSNLMDFGLISNGQESNPGIGQ